MIPITIVKGVYQRTYNWWAPHCSPSILCQRFNPSGSHEVLRGSYCFDRLHGKPGGAYAAVQHQLGSQARCAGCSEGLKMGQHLGLENEKTFGCYRFSWRFDGVEVGWFIGFNFFEIYFHSPHHCVGFLFLDLYLPLRLPLPSAASSLSHTIFFTHIFVTHIFVTHHLSHTPSFTHTHTSLSHNIFVTHHLSHTSLSHTIFHTHLCHTLLMDLDENGDSLVFTIQNQDFIVKGWGVGLENPRVSPRKWAR